MTTEIGLRKDIGQKEVALVKAFAVNVHRDGLRKVR